ncbi:MAG: VanZ family protein [Bacilli bacterium]|nr:VanZ family protein [Bacilli bacterium]
MKYKIFIIIFLLIGWAGVIFYASNKTSTESNKASKNLIKSSLVISIKITNKLNITDIDIREQNINKIVEEINYPLRKCAHATVFLYLLF